MQAHRLRGCVVCDSAYVSLVYVYVLTYAWYACCMVELTCHSIDELHRRWWQGVGMACGDVLMLCVMSLSQYGLCEL